MNCQTTFFYKQMSEELKYESLNSAELRSPGEWVAFGGELVAFGTWAKLVL